MSNTNLQKSSIIKGSMSCDRDGSNQGVTTLSAGIDNTQEGKCGTELKEVKWKLEWKKGQPLSNMDPG